MIYVSASPEQTLANSKTYLWDKLWIPTSSSSYIIEIDMLKYCGLCTRY
jgi:hypothetical protein